MCVCGLYCLSRVRPVKLIVVVKTEFGPSAQRKTWHARTHAHTHADMPLPIYMHDSGLGHARNVSPINSVHLLSVLCSPRLYLLVVM